MLFFVKVKIDLNKLFEFANELASGRLNTNPIKITYCLKEEPEIGLSIWESENRQSFDNIFKEHKKFYKEVYEIIPVITADESKEILFNKISK